MPYTPSSNLTNQLPQSTVIYYEKQFIENLKSETPFLRQCTRRDLPENSGNQMKLFMFQPLGANVIQSSEGTVGSGITVAVQTTTAQIGEYSDFANFSSLALATAIDPLVEDVEKELSYRLGQSVSQVIRTVWDSSAATIDSSVKVGLAATSTTSYSTLTNTQLRSSVMSMLGRSIKPLDGQGLMGGVIHPFPLGDILSDTSNNSPLDLLKHTPQGLQKLEDLGANDLAEIIEFPSTSVAFCKTPLVNVTANYTPPGGPSISGLSALRTYIFGKDALIAIRLGAKGDTAIGDGNWQNIKCNVVQNAPLSVADPAGLIPGWTSKWGRTLVTGRRESLLIDSKAGMLTRRNPNWDRERLSEETSYMQYLQ